MPSYIELDKQGSFPAASNVGKTILGVNSDGTLQLTNSNGASTNVSGDAIKKYVAKLQEVGAGTVSNGLLKVGEIYYISSYNSPDDFSNVAYVISGVINETDCLFVATGTTPNSFTASSSLEIGENPYAISPLVNNLGYTKPVFWSNAYGLTGQYFFNFPEAVDPSKVMASLTPTSLSNVNSFITYANNTTVDHLVEYWNNYVTNGTVRTLSVQSDGKIIVGGDFRYYNGNERNRLTRIYSSGIEDVTFYTNLTSVGDTTGFDSNIYIIAVQSDGKILVGGTFSQLNGITRNRLVRLNSDGTEDTIFYSNLISSGDNSGFNDIIKTIAIQSDGKIIVGGGFSTLNGNSRKFLVRLNSDGTEDTTFYTNIISGGDSSGFDGYVSTTAIQSDGKIIVGGTFEVLNGNVKRFLVRLNSDGTEDTTFYTNLTSTGSNYGFGGDVYTTAIQSDGKILVGGIFGALNGDSNYQSLCRLNSTGIVDSSYIIQPNSNVYSMTVEPSDILMVGGTFSTIKNGTISTTKSLARIDVNGNIINDFANTSVGSGAGVNALAQQGYNRIMVGMDDYNYIYNIYSGYDVFLSVKDSTDADSTTLNNMPIEIRNYS